MKFFIAFILLSSTLFAQTYQSVIQEQTDYYNQKGISAEDYYAINNPTAISRSLNEDCQLNKMVFGWHPYWQNGYEDNYDWNLISDFCYFSYELDASTGYATSTHSFETTSVVDDALASGTKVHLCVTLFSGHSTFLENATSKQNLIDDLISKISARAAHGVNIDFEGVASSQKDNLTNFMIDLSQQMHAAISNSIVSIDLPAVDWSSTFDVGAMAGYVDYFMIMGYDYYWGGSAEAGPHSPLYTFNDNYDYNLSKSISFYTHAGAPEDQLVLGVPYYGREWPTVDDAVPSSTTATGSTITYKSVKNNTSGNYSNRLWEANSQNPYYIYNDGEWNQCFSDDEESLNLRYEMVHYRQLAGIGIWALGYDDGYTELWEAIEIHLTDCRIVACSDTIYDMGGPNHNYYNYEDYAYTIAPDGAQGLSLNFLEFEVENGWDTLWIYDGSDIYTSEIGNYTGTNSPGIVTASGASLTLRFNSDISTTAAGFKAVWQCYIDTENPTTSIQGPNDWQTENFVVDFTDNDNEAVEHSFYQIVEYDGVKESANTSLGYFVDDCEANIDQWTLQTGTWSHTSGNLLQTDEANSNTNAYASLTQTDASNILYQWRMKISGSGANRRAGIYIFSDDASQDQRNNAYMVYFRVDQNKCQIYKSESNVIDIKTNDTCVVNLDTWYDYKLLFEPLTGLFRVYQDNQLVSEWVDDTPLTSGEFISLRTGECSVAYDDFRVYKSRTSQVNVAVEEDDTNDVRLQNISPNIASCFVYSIVKDVNENFSSIATRAVDIDWSASETIMQINDGLITDIDTTYDNSALQANWEFATDENSGIMKYWYAIGTTSGNTDIMDWTDNLSELSFSESLGLDYNQTYYVSVKSENNAGLISDVHTSDGLLVLDQNVNVNELGTQGFKIYPNPANDYIHFKFPSHFSSLLIEIYSIKSELIRRVELKSGEAVFVGDLSSGMYIIKLEGKAYLIQLN